MSDEPEGWNRQVQKRCINIDRHRSGPGCACHPNIPEPCENCYCIEILSRKIPYEPTNYERKPFEGEVIAK